MKLFDCFDASLARYICIHTLTAYSFIRLPILLKHFPFDSHTPNAVFEIYANFLDFSLGFFDDGNCYFVSFLSTFICVRKHRVSLLTKKNQAKNGGRKWLCLRELISVGISGMMLWYWCMCVYANVLMYSEQTLVHVCVRLFRTWRIHIPTDCDCNSIKKKKSVGCAWVICSANLL